MNLIYSTFIILIVITISITIIIIISIITCIIAIIINSTKDYILDKKVFSLFTFSSISYWQAGLGIVQCCNIVPSFVSSIGESWDSGLYFAPQLPRGFDHFYGTGRGGEPPLPRGEGSPRDGAAIPDLNTSSSSVNHALKLSGMASPTLNFVPCNSDFHTSPKAPSTIAYVVNSENGMGSGGSKYKTTSTKCWSSFLLSILSELRYLRTHLWRYLRVLRFQLTLSQSTAKMCAHASICAWTCENQSKNIYACLDLHKSLHKCLLKKIRLLQFAL